MRAGHLEHHGDARGVVVGAGVELAVAHAQVVEMRRHDDPLVAEDGSEPRSMAPTLRPWIRARLAAGIAWMNCPSKSGSSLSRRNSSIRKAAAFLGPLPLPAPNSGEASISRPLWPQPVCSGRRGAICALGC